jgi:cobalt-zinc-cadmium efflux system outer membrane protein
MIATAAAVVGAGMMSCRAHEDIRSLYCAMKRPGRMYERSMLASRSLVVVMTLVAGASRAGADDTATQLPAELTMKQAIDLFRTHGLDLLIAEANVTSAEGDLTAAGAIPNPGLSISYGPPAFYISRSGPCPPTYSAFGASITDNAAIEDSLSGKRGLRKDVAGAALRAARLSQHDADRTLVFQVKSAFEQLLLAQEAVTFALDTAEANVKVLDKTQKQRDEGKIQSPDLERVLVAKLESDQAVDQARQQVRRARAQLAFLLGVRNAVPEFAAVDSELVAYHHNPATLASLSHDDLLAQAFKARPDLAAQEAQLASAQASLTLAKRQRFPDIAVSLSYAQQGTDQFASSPPTFSIGLSAPIPVLYQQQGEIKKAEAQVRIQQLTVTKLRAQIVNDFESAYADFTGSQALVTRMEDEKLLATAKAASDDTYTLYSKGAAQLVDYLVALQTYISTKNEYLGDVANYWTAVFELEAAVGKELR